MAGTKINARDIIIEVQDSDGSTWLEIDGLNSATINPSANEQTADTTTFGSQGAYEQEVMQRGRSMSLAGFIHKDDTGAQDPGQARCETVAEQVGTESKGIVRFRYPNDSEWIQWTATFSLDQQGGGNNAKGAWGLTLTRSGQSSTVTVS